MVEHVLAKDEMGVRFSLAAQNIVSFTQALFYRDFVEIVDNYVSNVYKGHSLELSFWITFS